MHIYIYIYTYIYIHIECKFACRYIYICIHISIYRLYIERETHTHIHRENKKNGSLGQTWASAKEPPEPWALKTPELNAEYIAVIPIDLRQNVSFLMIPYGYISLNKNKDC